VAEKDTLVVKNVEKRMGHRQILKDVSFQASTGDVVAITGGNGAGKTTLLRIIAGLWRKSGGEVLWNGSSMGLDQGRTAYISHQPMLYGSLSVGENLAFFGRMYGTMNPDRLQELLELVGLWLYRLEPASALSRGMQQRLAIARALMADPALILYDEPFTSLDADGRNMLRQVLESRRSSTVQLVVTHELGHLAGLAFREIMLKGGRAVQGRDGHA